ncbi:MAG: glutamate racemase [Candidatus Omnitrophota bacterium]
MKLQRNRPIGVFDSGLGGLTVVKSVHRLLPNEDIIYFGDTARVPYGNKSRSSVIRFSREITAFLVTRGVKMVVVACNTASSLSLSSLRRTFPVPIIGVINSGVTEALRVSKNKRIAVIGTNSTISSRVYDIETAKKDPSCHFYSQKCPLFVPLVENGLIKDEITYQIARRYLNGLKSKNIDTLILGCTHYPALKAVIKSVMRGVNLVDSSSMVAKDVKEILLEKGLARSASRRTGRISTYVSDDVEGFNKSAGIFFKKRLKTRKAIP